MVKPKDIQNIVIVEAGIREFGLLIIKNSWQLIKNLTTN